MVTVAIVVLNEMVIRYGNYDQVLLFSGEIEMFMAQEIKNEFVLQILCISSVFAEGEGQQLSENDLSLLMLLMKQNGNSLDPRQQPLGSSFSSSVSPSASSLLSSSQSSSSSLLSSFGQQSQFNPGSFLASRPALSFENPRGTTNSAQAQVENFSALLRYYIGNIFRIQIYSLLSMKETASLVIW